MLEGKNKELKSKLGGLGRRVRTLELMEARRLGLSVPELRELSTDQAELARRLKKWASEE